jgi:hypothetical protein
MKQWLLTGLAFIAAVVCFVAGLIVWSQMSQPPVCSSGYLCALYGPPYRLHPLRAELLWGASAAFALLAIWSTLLVVRKARLSDAATA